MPDRENNDSLAKLGREGSVVVETGSREETFELGRQFGEASRAGEVYTLTGDLGAGKTVFAQGFAWGLGITEPVNSPTFTILQIYEGGRLPLCHFDVYRIADVGEMEETGYEDYFYGDGVCLIEWANLIEEILPESCIRIEMIRKPERGFDSREITVSRGAGGRK